MTPLYGFVQGDTLGLVVVVDERATIAEVVAMLFEAASMRVAPRPDLRLRWRDRVLDPDLTVAAAGLEALDRVDVIAAAGEG